LHGHQYGVEITAESTAGLDVLGRVVDFSVLKGIYDPWIQEKFDHGFILHRADKSAIQALEFFSEKEQVKQKIYLLDFNPTAENLARFFLDHTEFVTKLEPHFVKVVKVVVHETPNCSAEACLKE